MTSEAGPGLRARRRRAARRAATAALVLAGVAALAAHASVYYPHFFADDAFISMRYAERLALGDGLTWTDGERVEGYTNLLWVLLLAAARLVTEDLLNAARALGLLASASIVVALARAYPVRRARDVVPLLVGAALVAVSTSVAAWSVAGLEQPLLAAGLAWALALGLPFAEGERPMPRRALGAGAALGVVVLARSDGALFVALFALGLLAAHRFRPRAVPLVLALVAVPLALWLAQLGFRLAYYGDWVPNTAHAKVAFTAHRIESGWEYVTRGAWLTYAPALVMALAALALPLARGRRGRLVVLLVLFAGGLAYVIGIGGDNMPQRRHLVALVVVGAFAGAELMRAAARRRLLAALGALAAVTVVGHTARVQLADEARLYGAAPGGWAWAGVSTGDLFRRAFAREQPLVAVDAAGAFPYYSRLPALDMLGLTDRYLATHPPPTFGTGWVGHELGDGEYVLSRAPDLVLFGNHVGYPRGVWLSGREMFAMPEFHRRYRLVAMVAPDGTRADVFVRVEGRAGVRRAQGRLTIPALLFAQRGAVARLDRDDRLVVAIPPRGAVSCDVDVPAGRWRVSVDASGPLEWSTRDAERSGGQLALESGRWITLELSAERSAEVRSVTLSRAGER